MKKICLTQGKIALVDDDQFELLIQWRWFAHREWKNFYAVRCGKVDECVNGKRPLIRMHHTIAGFPPKGLMADHCDGNGLNNQRENLRFVTCRQNQQNQTHRNKSSQYPGVCWDKSRQKWIVCICVSGIQKNLGRFTDEFEAFTAYKQAVESLGETIVGDR
jgi:hypothetical protein